MKWLERKAKNGVRHGVSPSVPAVGVRVYMHHKEGQRMCFYLNKAFIKAARLQPGDRLAIGVDEDLGTVGLQRNADGNAISGKGWSMTPQGISTKSSRATPFVNFGSNTFPDAFKWAESRHGRWIVMHDKGTHWESAE